MEPTYTYQPDQMEREAIFVASCVESLAKELKSTTEDVYLRMDKVGLIKDYILPCYDVLHAESRSNVTKDILFTLNLWEEKKGVAR